MSNYPEHEKLKALMGKSQENGQFLDWLTQDKGYVLCQENAEQELIPVSRSISDLLSEFHGIDQWKLEDEKRAMVQEYKPPGAD